MGIGIEAVSLVISSMLTVSGVIAPMELKTPALSYDNQITVEAPEAPAEPSPVEVELAAYLEAKGSPMPADVLLQYDNWPAIVAVANAESSLGRHNAGSFNAWGIKYFGPKTASNVNGKYRNFASWEDSIQYASELLYKYDSTDGQPTPEAMVRRWKSVAPFGGWIKNVRGTAISLKAQVPSGAELIKI
jgi:hypothetical protein